MSRTQQKQDVDIWQRFGEAVRVIADAYDVLGQEQYVNAIATSLKATPQSLNLADVPALYELIGSVDERLVGLYLFEACFSGYRTQQGKPLAQTFIESWERSKKEHEPASPGVNRGRLEKHLNRDPSGWHALYLGKGNNLRGRISDHLFGNKYKGWSCLRLGERFKVFEGVSLRLSWCAIPMGADHYDLVIPYFEKRFHELWEPIMGNSR